MWKTKPAYINGMKKVFYDKIYIKIKINEFLNYNLKQQ